MGHDPADGQRVLQPADNTINFPAAILQPPFFYAEATTRSTTAASVR
jgi:predicted metalloendopeptidase